MVKLAIEENTDFSAKVHLIKHTSLDTPYPFYKLVKNSEYIIILLQPTFSGRIESEKNTLASHLGGIASLAPHNGDNDQMTICSKL